MKDTPNRDLLEEILERVKPINATLRRLEYRMAQLLTAQGILLEEQDEMSTDLDALKQQVEETAGAEASALVFIQGLIEKLTAAQNNPAEIAAIVARLKASEDALSQAIAAEPEEPTTPV